MTNTNTSLRQELSNLIKSVTLLSPIVYLVLTVTGFPPSVRALGTLLTTFGLFTVSALVTALVFYNAIIR